jgi:hypothetical protein
MDLAIYLPSLALIGLIFYSLKKWILKGEIFHPGLIYSLVNSVFFLVFAFGPYTYNVKIDRTYYYLYSLVTIAFVIGITLGEKKKDRRFIKDINLSLGKALILMTLIILPVLETILGSGILTGDLTLEDTARNNLYQAALAQQSREEINFLNYFLGILFNSFLTVSTSCSITTLLLKKKKLYVILWLLSGIVASLVANSRTLLLNYINALIIPFFITQKLNIAKTFSKINLKLIIKKNIIILILAFFVFVGLTIIITNLRNEVRSQTTVGGEGKTYELVEYLYRAERKDWFTSATKILPKSLVISIAELSMYAGGTVATGGYVSNLVSETGWYTWGLRNFFFFHRVLSQLRLDGGFSEMARDNWTKIVTKASQTFPAFVSSWIGDPGNLITDFGYVGAPIASLMTGWVIGWMYSRFSKSGPVIRATTTVIFALPMLLTPALHFFSLNISNTINFFFLLYWYFTKSRRVIYQNDMIFLHKK